MQNLLLLPVCQLCGSAVQDLCLFCSSVILAAACATAACPRASEKTRQPVLPCSRSPGTAHRRPAPRPAYRGRQPVKKHRPRKSNLPAIQYGRDTRRPPALQPARLPAAMPFDRLARIQHRHPAFPASPAVRQVCVIFLELILDILFLYLSAKKPGFFLESRLFRMPFY